MLLGIKVWGVIEVIGPGGRKRTHGGARLLARHSCLRHASASGAPGTLAAAQTLCLRVLAPPHQPNATRRLSRAAAQSGSSGAAAAADADADARL